MTKVPWMVSPWLVISWTLSAETCCLKKVYGTSMRGLERSGRNTCTSRKLSTSTTIKLIHHGRGRINGFFCFGGCWLALPEDG